MLSAVFSPVTRRPGLPCPLLSLGHWGSWLLLGREVVGDVEEGEQDEQGGGSGEMGSGEVSSGLFGSVMAGVLGARFATVPQGDKLHAVLEHGFLGAIAYSDRSCLLLAMMHLALHCTGHYFYSLPMTRTTSDGFGKTLVGACTNVNVFLYNEQTGQMSPVRYV
ncbi:hypothetical protein PVAP13_9KG125500 [Panicum virgatum]|uniref:Uncharacterized protein n=1 Tax=Panicum virgatum TaxID=38727 RepID=A0A8T0NEM6_PANVG|nr:hypothetical protein PVAP13_9KG125500 [Panicum virgatum]